MFLIFLVHFTLMIVIIFLGSIILFRIEHNYIVHKARSDLDLLLTFICFSVFLVVELFTLLLFLFEDFFPNTRFTFDPFFFHVYHSISTGSLIAGAMIISTFLIWIVKSAGVTFKISKWELIIISGLFFLIMYLDIFESKIHYLGDYPIIIINYPILSFTSIVVIIFLMALNLLPPYLRFLGLATVKQFTSKNDDSLKYSILMLIGILVYIFYVTIRNHFVNSWTFLIILDIVLIISFSVGVFTSFSYGFSELMLCAINIKSLYIIHSSGKLINARDFKKMRSYHENIFGAFLISINAMVKEIRTEGGLVEQLVLKNDETIIFQAGIHCSGIIIAKKFNNLFKEKLGILIGCLDNHKKEKIKQWNEPSKEILSYIQNKLEELF